MMRRAVLCLALVAGCADITGPLPPPTGVRTSYHCSSGPEWPARLLADAVRPEYPECLLRERVEGEVLVQVVVDTFGRAEMVHYRMLHSSHVAFTESVEQVLPRLRFAPANVGGRRVKQLIRLPFVFSLSATPQNRGAAAYGALGEVVVPLFVPRADGRRPAL